MLKHIMAFVKKDFRLAASYRMSFFTTFIGLFLSSASFFFMAKLVPRSANSALSAYGGDYYSFVIIGTAFMALLMQFQSVIPQAIRGAQASGTLEALMLTQANLPAILIGSSLYQYLFSSSRTILNIFMAIFLFGMKLGNINWLGVLIVFVLTAAVFLGMGLVTTSFVLVFKQNMPFTWVYGSASSLMGGMMFPITMLPPWLRWISYLLPATYSLDGIRKSMLSNGTFAVILPNILVLLALSVVILPIGIFSFSLAIKKAKMDGSLTHI